MLSKLELIVNGVHSLHLPAEGLDISLLKNEFNLLTNDVAENRPLSITETFEIPLEENRRIFDDLKGQDKVCELRYNDIVLIAGPLSEYSVDEQRKKILVTITSAFKQVVDFMGDNVFYLDTINLSRWNYTAGNFSEMQDNELLKFGHYNPMDTSTGRIEFTPDNVNSFCKPSLSLLEYFKEVFRLNGWTANWDTWTDLQKNVCLLPTTPYTVSSWGFKAPNTYTIPANGNVSVGFPNPAWNSPAMDKSAWQPSLLNDTLTARVTSGGGIVITGDGWLEASSRRPGDFWVDVDLNKMGPSSGPISMAAEIEVLYAIGNVSVAFRYGANSASFRSVVPETKKTLTITIPNVAYAANKISLAFPGMCRIRLSNIRLAPIVIPRGCSASGTSIQPRSPNRNTAFKLKAQYQSVDTFDIQILEGQNELGYIQALGETKINYTTDIINTKEGVDPLSIKLINQNPHPIKVMFDIFDFYNLFTIYETNEDEYISPENFTFPVADNFPQLTPLEVYREFMTLFQMAQTSEDSISEVDYYFINDIQDKNLEKVDVNPFLLWNGYTILSDKINGLAKLNSIRYKEDTKQQRYFKVDIAPLPASNTYFESLFAPSKINAEWGAVIIPGLKYKVKTIENDISVEYLEWSDIPPQLAYYDQAGRSMQFNQMKIPNIVANYWSQMLSFMSSYDGYTPVVFELKLRLYYYQFHTLFRQRNLFYYTSNALLIDGKYDVIKQEFTGIFISLR